ncbi:hypothetical protein D9O50_00780 [Oxalobacteraceae bacterium CAVE-383]|nr:hypothetical protein D9O50_00780 [Oxalobacteraceae bacterium CAVE-383]
MEGGKEQNFWPGFVDALSNVVLVMIFVVVVFVVTLFYYSQKLAEYKLNKYVEKRDTQTQIMHPATAGAHDQANSEVTQKSSNAPQAAQDAKDKQISELKNQVAALRVQLAGQAMASAVAAVTGSTRSENEQPNHIIEVKPGEKAKATETGARLESAGQSLVLHFADDSTTLDDAAVKSLNADVAPWVEQLKKGQGKIVVSGAVGALGYTEGRRRAYYRAVAVRNQLIALGVEPGKVISRVVPGDATSDSGSRVLLQFTTQDPK